MNDQIPRFTTQLAVVLGKIHIFTEFNELAVSVADQVKEKQRE